MANHGELQEQVFEANRELVRAGLVVLTFGNVSGVDRDAERARDQAERRSLRELRPEAIVVVDLETGEVVAGDRRPSSDTPTHAVLYRRFAGARRHRAHALPLRERLGAGRARASLLRHDPRRPLPRPGSRDAPAGSGRDPGRLRAADRRRDRRDVRTPRARPARDSGGLSHRMGRSPGVPTSHGRSRTRSRSRRWPSVALYTLVLKAEASALDDDLLDRHFSRKHGPNAYYGQPR